MNDLRQEDDKHNGVVDLPNIVFSWKVRVFSERFAAIMMWKATTTNGGLIR